MMRRHQGGSINLWTVSILMMAVTVAGLAFLYTIRYGHLPFQDTWARWGKSANVISSELQNASGVQLGSEGVRPAATVEKGIRQCTIQGKVVFSDTVCTDQNPTSRDVKLHDNRGFVTPKAVKPESEGASPALDNEQVLRFKALDKAIEKSTGR